MALESPALISPIIVYSNPACKPSANPSIFDCRNGGMLMGEKTVAANTKFSPLSSDTSFSIKEIGVASNNEKASLIAIMALVLVFNFNQLSGDTNSDFRSRFAFDIDANRSMNLIELRLRKSIG